MERKHSFIIEINLDVEKKIKRLDSSIKKVVKEKINNLENFPFPKDPKHMLSIFKNNFLAEINIDKIRVYYLFTLEKIYIYNIEYRGKVNVFDLKKDHKSGNKNYPNQRKYIQALKKWFKKKFK